MAGRKMVPFLRDQNSVNATLAPTDQQNRQ
jgi:hypothetical protein